jgi:hypothetical protein
MRGTKEHIERMREAKDVGRTVKINGWIKGQ